MSIPKELNNGILIFIGIGLYFLTMELLGLSDVFLLRILNIFIVIYFLNKTIKSNYNEGKTEYLENLISGTLTALIGVALSVAGLLTYISMKGGDAYLAKLSQNFLFGGGTPSVNEYCIGLFFEGIASSIIITFTLMQYWKDRPVKHF
ncbi:hypothetical protein SAMN05660845_1355 [Flavobacterium swingsii]|jgi:hypothetical protein|uniref:DUF4199 domain-containing protein n=1 Tax=Flavobacterium swingsii TaxID=498292 RepID=A0A1I0XPN7_9FLAO|nr:hypothetical protein [Flavobacterium swingsii]SFB02158.1 hypothetical protein SAMN05660845_1355 [Flavobacterium swingsii]